LTPFIRKRCVQWL